MDRETKETLKSVALGGALVLLGAAAALGALFALQWL